MLMMMMRLGIGVSIYISQCKQIINPTVAKYKPEITWSENLSSVSDTYFPFPIINMTQHMI